MTERCFWAGSDPEYRRYHDEEWGYPVDSDVRLFEKICLESFQSGLSWRTILNKRENFRVAFAGFDFHELAHWGEPEVQRLLQDAGIVRHRGKIEATLNNAKRAVELVDEAGSIAAFAWRYEPRPETRPARMTADALRALSKTPESAALAKALKQRGWRFFGPTTAYAFMQAMGLVNDHVETCAFRAPALAARAAFTPPR